MKRSIATVIVLSMTAGLAHAALGLGSMKQAQKSDMKIDVAYKIKAPPGGTSGGLPPETRMIDYDYRWVLEHGDTIELAKSYPSLRLKPNRTLKSIEVLVKGKGILSVVVGSEAHSRVEVQHDDWQTVSLQLGALNIPETNSGRVALQVENIDSTSLAAIQVKTVTSVLEGSLSSQETSGSKVLYRCDVDAASAYYTSWYLSFNGKSQKYNSPTSLFSAIQSNCLPEYLQCDLARNGEDKFAVRVWFAGSPQFVTGSMSYSDADARLSTYVRSGICAY